MLQAQYIRDLNPCTSGSISISSTPSGSSSLGWSCGTQPTTSTEELRMQAYRKSFSNRSTPGLTAVAQMQTTLPSIELRSVQL